MLFIFLSIRPYSHINKCVKLIPNIANTYKGLDGHLRNSPLFISAMKIHISSETAAALQSFESFNVELRGELEIKVRRKSNVGWLLVIYYNEYFRARVS